jgi:EAL domain-containing protein (putative c-di-GMP-specific phosphodiesterase class I)
VEAVTQIAAAMGIATVAERVDSAEVLEQLAVIGVQYAQGHYIAAPQPVEVLQSVLAAAPHSGRLDDDDEGSLRVG